MTQPEVSLESFRASVAALSERFRRQEAKYRGAGYNEETARSEFISPFFEALGWDVSNRQGHALQYRDVVHEESIKVGDATKAPDYTFRIGGSRKFFVEAKKPGVDLKNLVEPAYQLRRYAWSAKLALSVLTDFEELAVYDTRIRPKDGDKASVARVFYFRHEEFASRAEEIWNVFAKQSVLQGSFDAYAEEKRKRGTSEVDAEFLKEIESWREELAKNLALRNELSVDELNYAVQATIDRILFLRIAEGRGAEIYGRLLALTNGQNTYKRLAELFQDADDRYNSGIFDFRSDKLTLKLKLDDKVLKPILAGLYYPESPYEFSVLPAEILGNVYEQFLGKVIRLTEGGRAKVEEKPEVKKAGGVYYTPSYIVDYIVAQTVGVLIEGKSPKEMAKIRVLDPACGSGSFLLVAYQKLMDAHLAWYREHEPRKHKEAVFEGPGGDWRLTTAEKRRILLSSIYGVDIDRQAVEVTKLSLLLKCLEGETNESLTQVTLFGDKALPSLEANIRCGNSLISSQALLRHLGGLFYDDSDTRRINPFDWQKAFPEAFKAGGFDAVVGNPPWGQKEISKDTALSAVCAAEFPSSRGIFDLYRPFVELGIRSCSVAGRWGFVLPDIVLLKDYQSTREFILKNLAISSISAWGLAFRKVTLDVVTIVGSKENDQRKRQQSQVDIAVHGKQRVWRNRLAQSVFESNEAFKFNLFLTPERIGLLSKLAKFPKFGDAKLFAVHEGVHSGNVRGKLFLDAKPKHSNGKKLVLGREEVARYRLSWGGRWVDCTPGLVRKDRGEYANLGREDWYTRDKIVIRRTGDRLVCALDTNHLYFSNNVFIAFPHQKLEEDLRYFLAILNSRLVNWFYLAIQPRQGRVFSEVKIVHISQFPIRLLDFNDRGDARTHEQLLKLVDGMMELQSRLPSARTEHDRSLLARQMEATDEEIDRLVYWLYDLSPKEIELIEAT